MVQNIEQYLVSHHLRCFCMAADVHDTVMCVAPSLTPPWPVGLSLAFTECQVVIASIVWRLGCVYYCRMMGFFPCCTY